MKKKLDAELSSCGRELVKKDEEIRRHINTIQQIRDDNDSKEEQKEQIKKVIKDIESRLQEKSKLAGFSSKLKNELHIKNVEIMARFNKQQNDNVELKKRSSNIEKQLENNLKLVNIKNEEIDKKEDRLEEYKNKYEKERHNVKMLEKELDNLLQKIYDTFQTNDKNSILKGIEEIKKIYLTEKQIRKIETSRLNDNIRDELTKQIDFLQKGILSIADLKTKRENKQNNEIYKKTKENSSLIEQLNKKKKDYTHLEKDFFIKKSNLSALQKKFEQLEREEKTLIKNNPSLFSSMNNNTNSNNNLPTLNNNKIRGASATSNKVNTSGSINNNNLMNRTTRNGFKLKLDTNLVGDNAEKRGPIENEEKNNISNMNNSKIGRSNTVSGFKKTRTDAYNMNDIKIIFEEKNEIIRRQRIEITILRNNLAEKEKVLQGLKKEEQKHRGGS